MDGCHATATHLEVEAMRVEPQPCLLLPEVTAPPVVIPADHENGQARGQPSQRRRDVKAAAGNDSRIGKPEVEQVAVDEETIPEVGDGVEKGEKPLLDGWGGRPEVRVGDDDQSAAEHGAKDDPLHSPPQPV